MAKTTSFSFPYLIDVSRNCVSILEDEASVVNRTRLLLLTEPTEIYDVPRQGVGLKRYLWRYNNENTVAEMEDRIKDQLREYEPYVDADHTSFENGLLFSGTQSEDKKHDHNRLKLTVGVKTIFGDELDIDLTEYAESLYKEY